MELKRLALKGFMRFKDKAEIEFPEGQVTLIAGENGSGKTSLLDAICICLYGKTFRTSGRADSGFLNMNDLVNHDSTKATIHLEFENHGHNYIVKRKITQYDSDGEILEDGGLKASGHFVYDYVKNVAIGLDWNGFRKSTIVLQGEMSALTELRPTERKEAFVRLFGIDVYYWYDGLTKRKIDEREGSIGKIEEANKILSSEVEKIPLVRKELSRIKRRIVRLEKRRSTLNEKVRERKGSKDALEDDYNRYSVLKERLGNLDKTISNLKSTIRTKKSELKKLTRLEGQLPNLEKLYEDMSSIEKQIHRLRPLKSQHDKLIRQLSKRRAKLQAKNDTVKSERKDLQNKRKEIAELKKEIPLRKDLARVKSRFKKIEETKSKFEKQKATFEGEIKRLKGSVRDLRRKMKDVKGKDKCPVCLQKIKDPAEVMRHYSEEIQNLQEERKKVGEQLSTVTLKIEKVNNELREVEKEKKELEEKDKKRGELSREQRNTERLKGKIDGLRQEIKKISEQVKKCVKAIERLKFSPKEYSLLDSRLSSYRRRKIAEKFSNAKTQVDRLPQVKMELEANSEELSTSLKKRGELSSDIKKFGNIETRYKKATKALESAQQLESENAANLSRENANKESSERELEELKDKRNTFKKNKKRIYGLRNEIIMLEELRNVFKGIPGNILRRLRPYIEKEGTDIINELSNNEITALNIEDETLNVAATRYGELKPIHYFSGGEKTRINMALRVAISRILSKLPQTEEHTFAVMQTLFIDEGDFGNLDEPGTREAIAVIRNLTKEFDRVILISHVDAIREIFHGYTIEVVKTGLRESELKTYSKPVLGVETVRGP